MLSIFKKPNGVNRTRTPEPEQAAPAPAPAEKPKKDLNEVLDGYKLPSFPQAVMGVLKKFKDPKSSLAQISEQLQGDPGMSVRVLKVVNSAAYGVKNNVSRVDHAVSMLGRARVEALVVSIAVRRVMPGSNSKFFKGSAFWLVATRRACLARVLARELHPDTAAEAFTAGLLQDMAVPVLFDLHGDEYGRVYQAYNKGVGPLHKLEEEAFGYDHSAVGAIIARRWNLPDYLINAIGGHHGAEVYKSVDAAVKLVAPLRNGSRGREIEQLKALCEAHYGITQARLTEIFEEASVEAETFFKMLK